MEDVLEVYTRPYDKRRPQVCLDEGSKQLVTDLREALPMEPSHPKRIDYEYDPNGYCNLFVACEPLAHEMRNEIDLWSSTRFLEPKRSERVYTSV